MIIDQLFTRPLFEQAPMASPEQLAYNRLRAQHDGYQAMTGGGGNAAVSRDPAHAAKLATVPAELARMAAALKAKGIDAEAEYEAIGGPKSAPVDANQLYEFAPSDDDSNGSDPEELLRRMAAYWWNGNERQMAKVENTLAAMGWEIGQDDGYDDGGVFVVRAGDEHGGSYISWPHEDLELNEGRKKKKKKTSRSLGRYFFPGFGYYGSGESGEGGGDGGGGGESVNPGMAEGEYDSRKPFGVRYKVFAGREGRLTTREYYTSSEEKLQRAVDKIQALDNFYEIDGYSYPKEQQGVTEGSEQKPAITYKDYTLQYDYQTEDDDPEGYSTATTYYFDVLKDGDRVGEAEYFDYFGNLTIIINGQTMEFKYRHPLAMQISQLVSSLPDEQKKDLSDPRFESQGVAEKLGDNRPKLGSKRDQGKSVRKWRQARGLDESGMAEGKADYNFDIEDLKRLERIRDLPTLKTQAMMLISKPSAKPMRPEKVEWFKNALERMTSPMAVIKLMYDLLLSGEGYAVVGSKSSMNPNSYRQRFNEQDATEDALAGMKRLAGIATVPAQTTPGLRQYRHMPTAVQPR